MVEPRATRDDSGLGAWRIFALPLVPLVADWDAAKVVLRWCGELGVRLLEKTDPFFARFASFYFRIAERFRPAFERLAAFLEPLGHWLGPPVRPVTELLRATGRSLHAAGARISRISIRCGG